MKWVVYTFIFMVVYTFIQLFCAIIVHVITSPFKQHLTFDTLFGCGTKCFLLILGGGFIEFGLLRVQR